AHRGGVPVAGRGLCRAALRAKGDGMSELTSKKCVPCEGGAAPLARAQAQDLLKQLQPEWKLADDGKTIASEWKFPNFFHTMSFVNAVAHVANAEDHHPGLEVGYGYCRIRY